MHAPAYRGKGKGGGQAVSLLQPRSPSLSLGPVVRAPGGWGGSCVLGGLGWGAAEHVPACGAGRAGPAEHVPCVAQDVLDQLSKDCAALSRIVDEKVERNKKCVAHNTVRSRRPAAQQQQQQQQH